MSISPDDLAALAHAGAGDPDTILAGGAASTAPDMTPDASFIPAGLGRYGPQRHAQGYRGLAGLGVHWPDVFAAAAQAVQAQDGAMQPVLNALDANAQSGQALLAPYQGASLDPATTSLYQQLSGLVDSLTQLASTGHGAYQAGVAALPSAQMIDGSWHGGTWPKANDPSVGPQIAFGKVLQQLQSLQGQSNTALLSAKALANRVASSQTAGIAATTAAANTQAAASAQALASAQASVQSAIQSANFRAASGDFPGAASVLTDPATVTAAQLAGMTGDLNRASQNLQSQQVAATAAATKAATDKAAADKLAADQATAAAQARADALAASQNQLTFQQSGQQLQAQIAQAQADAAVAQAQADRDFKLQMAQMQLDAEALKQQSLDSLNQEQLLLTALPALPKQLQDQALAQLFGLDGSAPAVAGQLTPSGQPDHSFGPEASF